MSEIKIRPATLEDRAFIRSISERTWPSTYGHIISQEQIAFMLDWMYSDVSLAEQFAKGHQFYIAGIHKGDGPVDEVGFCSVSKEDIEKSEAELVDEPINLKATAHKLNKLYVLPSAHGTGSGKALLNKAIEVSKAEGSSSLFLQVNKHNNAYTFYVKNGFIKEQEFKFDIGNGFYMDDYIMRLTF
jgi:GNAT superfamily N-acetyltransferase